MQVSQMRILSFVRGERGWVVVVDECDVSLRTEPRILLELFRIDRLFESAKMIRGSARSTRVRDPEGSRTLVTSCSTSESSCLSFSVQERL